MISTLARRIRATATTPAARLFVLSIVCSCALGTQAQAQTPKPPERAPTLPPELGWGQARPEGDLEIPDLTRGRAPVDRRQQYDVLATQGVILPNAYVPESDWGVLLRDHMLLGLQASAWFKGLMLTGTYAFSPSVIFDEPLTLDDYSSLTLTYNFWRSYDVRVSASAGYLGRKGRTSYDSEEQGLSLNLVADFNLSDTMVLTTGVQGFLPSSRQYYGWDFSGCQTRSDYLIRDCWRLTNNRQSWPAAGRFGLLYLQWMWFAPQELILKLELVTGLVQGTALNLEGAVYGRDNILVQQRRYESSDVTLGPLHGFPLTVHLAMGKTWGSFGAQLGLLMLPADDWRANRYGESPEPVRREWPVILPMMTLGYQLF